MKPKLFIICMMILSAGLFFSCIQNPENSANNSTKTENDEVINIVNNNGADNTNGISTKDNSLIFIGEETEDVDGTSYNVKSYALVYGSPYFYKYFKFYYLEEALKQVVVYYHLEGSCLDYKYTEFEEHYCHPTNEVERYLKKYICNYNEKGLLETEKTYINLLDGDYGTGELRITEFNYIYYDDKNHTIKCCEEKDETEGHTPYNRITYYYPNGKMALRYDLEYKNFTFNYESGYVKFYYDGLGTFKTFPDKVAKTYYFGTPSSTESLTEEEALAKLEELKAQFK